MGRNHLLSLNQKQLSRLTRCLGLCLSTEEKQTKKTSTAQQQKTHGKAIKLVNFLEQLPKCLFRRHEVLGEKEWGEGGPDSAENKICEKRL